MLFLPPYIWIESKPAQNYSFLRQQAGGSGSKQMIQSWPLKGNAVNKGPISFHFYCICIPLLAPGFRQQCKFMLNCANPGAKLEWLSPTC